MKKYFKSGETQKLEPFISQQNKLEVVPIQSVELLNKELRNAAKECDFTRLKKLVAQGADIHMPDENGETTLYKVINSFTLFIGKDAAELTAKMDEERLAIARWLVEKKQASTEVQTKIEGYTLLHVAVKRGYLNIVQWLVQTIEMRIDIPDGKGHTPLHIATRSSALLNVKVLAYLLETGKAKPDLQDKKGNTPLHYAVKIGNLPMVQCLVEQGKANYNIFNYEKETAVQLAVEAGYEEIVHYFTLGQKQNTQTSKGKSDTFSVSNPDKLKQPSKSTITPPRVPPRPNFLAVPNSRVKQTGASSTSVFSTGTSYLFSPNSIQGLQEKKEVESLKPEKIEIAVPLQDFKKVSLPPIPFEKDKVKPSTRNFQSKEKEPMVTATLKSPTTP